MAEGKIQIDTPISYNVKSINNSFTLSNSKAYRVGNILIVVVTGKATAALSNASIVQIEGVQPMYGSVYPATYGDSEWGTAGVCYVFFGGSNNMSGTFVTATLASGKWLHFFCCIPVIEYT